MRNYPKEQMRLYQRNRRAALRGYEPEDARVIEHVYQRMLRGNPTAFRRYRAAQELDV